MNFQNEDVEQLKHEDHVSPIPEEKEYLADIPLKFFKEPYLSDKCSFCQTRMIHPELGLYICPNEKCQFKYHFHPEAFNSVEVLKQSKLVRRHGR